MRAADDPASGSSQRAVVMFVDHDVTFDSRVLREAATLSAAGHRVTIMAGQPATPTPLERDGFQIVGVPLMADWSDRGIAAWPGRVTAVPGATPRAIKRVIKAAGVGLRRRLVDLRRRLVDLLRQEPLATLQRRIGFRRHLRRLRSRRRVAPGAPGAPGAPAAAPSTPSTYAAASAAAAAPHIRPGPALSRHRPWRRRRRTMHNSTWLWLRYWRYSVLRWAEAAAAAAPAADVWHAHDMPTLPAALKARRRHGGRVVYDSHEVFLESGTHATRPAWVRRLLGWVERRWARQADAIVTVNESIAEELARRLTIAPPIVVRNCPPRWLPDQREPPRFDLFRERLGIPPDRSILLYQGRFPRYKGVERTVEALGQPGLESCVAVFLGYGYLRDWLIEQAARPELAGRVHVMDAVLPEDLLPWTASADISVMPVERSTMNHYLISPNKLWESLAAGVPVVASDFPELRRVVQDVGAGELCEPSDPASVAAAVGRILARTPIERMELRGRCRAAALDHYNWETESARLVEVYAQLAPGPARTS